jgi:long-chain acyl-CoA synthetase
VYLADFARLHPDKAAVIRPATGEVRTFRELDDRANQLARLLHAHGLRRGDHVALYAENHVVFFEVIAACMRSGLYLTPINRHLPAGEAAYIADNCDARALIASAALGSTPELGDLTPRCEVKLSIGGAVRGFQDYDQALQDHPPERLIEESLGSFMLYSSGTTGRPKGIKRPLPTGPVEDGHPGTVLTARQFAMDGEAVYLSPAPLYHGAPIGYTTAVIQAGGTAVIMDAFDAEQALELIERYRVTHAMFVPTMFVRMLKLPDEVRNRFDVSSLRCAIHAAAPCPVEVKRRMIEWWGPVLEEFYSSSEMAGHSRIGSAEWLEHPGSVGRSTGLPFHICDDEGNELPPGEPGLIYGELPEAIRFSYHKDEDKTLTACHPRHPNWMTVGDVGYLDEDGYLYLTDRKSFMIISGGVNIYPQQIEDVLVMHPEVTDAAVIGVPNDELGEEVKAVIQPAPDAPAGEQLADELKAFVRERLGRQLTPRSIDFMDELPRLPTGKLYKKALREKYWPAPTA